MLYTYNPRFIYFTTIYCLMNIRMPISITLLNEKYCWYNKLIVDYSRLVQLNHNIFVYVTIEYTILHNIYVLNGIVINFLNPLRIGSISDTPVITGNSFESFNYIDIWYSRYLRILVYRCTGFTARYVMCDVASIKSYCD